VVYISNLPLQIEEQNLKKGLECTYMCDRKILCIPNREVLLIIVRFRKAKTI